MTIALMSSATSRILGALAFAATLAAASTGWADQQAPQSGTADAGRAVVRLEPDAPNRPWPAEIHVPAGTDVTWRNRSEDTVSLRFSRPVAPTCGQPADVTTVVVPAFGHADVCFAQGGRYDYIASNGEPGTGTPGADASGPGGMPTSGTGTIVVE
jgi:plastocyanin